MCVCQLNSVVAHEHIACGSVSIIMVNEWFLMMFGLLQMITYPEAGFIFAQANGMKRMNEMNDRKTIKVLN